MLHMPPINIVLLAAKQEPYKKAYYLLTKNIEEFSGRLERNGPAGRKKDQTERVRGLGRKTREEIVKWNQNDSPEILDREGRHQTTPASHWGQACRDTRTQTDRQEGKHAETGKQADKQADRRTSRGR